MSASFHAANGSDADARQDVGELSERRQDVLVVAAVAGAKFSIEVVTAVCERSAEQVRSVLEDEVAAGALHVIARDLGIYGFCDQGARAALYESVSPFRRRWLHRRIGEGLETIYPTGRERWLSELAYHFVNAAEIGPVDKAVEYSVGAARVAASRLAFDQAFALYEQALETLSRYDPDDHRRRAEVADALESLRALMG